MSFHRLTFVVLSCTLLSIRAGAQEPVNLARSAASGVRLTVSATYPGYGTDVLTDGKWVEVGRETSHDIGSPNRLGNFGNTWVSGEGLGTEQFVRVDWPEPVAINRVALWWSQSEWYPRAFRVEWLTDQAWLSVTGSDSWLVPVAQHSEVAFAPVRTRALRVVQHERGHGERQLMAMQEIEAFGDPSAKPGMAGARELAPGEKRRLVPMPLERNLTQLHVRQLGSVRAVAWTNGVPQYDVPWLHDGATHRRAEVPAGTRAVGYEWARDHVLDGAALIFPGELPAANPTKLETSTGNSWLPVSAGLRVERQPGQRRIVMTFEPVAARSLRVAVPESGDVPAEFEVYRYLPKSPNVWPERLVEDNRYEKELLASGREPSFDELCSVALSMTPAHALLGLKDVTREVGVTWDGSLVGTDVLDFRFGPEREALSEYPDTVDRKLIDQWRPGTVVTGQMGNLRVRQIAFVSFAGPGRAHPALFARWELTNLAGQTRETTVEARMRPRSAGPVTFGDGVLKRGERLALASRSPAQPGDAPHTLSIPVHLAAGETATVDFVAPYGDPAAVMEAAVYRNADFEAARENFQRYWDELLAPAVAISLPEPHLNLAYRAILAQLFINADGDVMPYGAEPSAYEGSLYGVEENYAMRALAFSGFHQDAARYMDATYLTPEFLVKVPAYTKYADRHQQYRNGLQPHYAIRLFRLTRDRQWIEKHRELLVQCAEWTLRQRRTTMELVDGERPLHWGLLPKWSYGGDIAGLQCHALYANFACWRGLVDTAWLMHELGDEQASQRYAAEAQDYRTAIDRAVEGNLRRDRTPPFLPLQLYATEPVGHDYDQLFYGCALDLQALHFDTGQVNLITDFMEQENLTFCLLPRFRRDVGPGGLDALYGMGYILTALQQDRIDEFLLALYAYAAFNLDRGTFASRETNLIYASDLHRQSQYKVPDVSDPLPCSSAVLLNFLRHMLVTEKLGGPGLPTGDLLLLFGTPRAWFQDARTIGIHQAPTDFGPVSCDVTSAVIQGRIEARVQPPTRNPWNTIALRLRHPEGKPLRAVTVNGEAWEHFDAGRELITLKPGPTEYRVVAQY